MAADCLAKMLTIEPHDRVDVAALLEHPFLQQYRWPEWEEPPSRNILSAAKDDIQLYDDSTMGVTEWRGVRCFLLVILITYCTCLVQGWAFDVNT